MRTAQQSKTKMTSTAPIQISFAQAEYEKKKKRTRRELFLEKMEQVVPWSRLLEVIEPFYSKGLGVRKGPEVSHLAKCASGFWETGDPAVS